MSDFLKGFEDPAAVARYAENPPRYMPGDADVQRIAAILLAEHVTPNYSIPPSLGAAGSLAPEANEKGRLGGGPSGVERLIDQPTISSGLKK